MNMQKKGMSAVKEGLKQVRTIKAWEKTRKLRKEGIIQGTDKPTDQQTDRQNDSEKENKMLDEGKNEMKKEVKQLHITPGSVVAVNTNIAELDRKQIRADLMEFDVAYVDYSDDGSLKGFVRFNSSESASKAVTSSDEGKWKFQLTRIADEEEKLYLKKAEEDRQKKFSASQKKKKKKGVDKAPLSWLLLNYDHADRFRPMS